MFNLFETTNLFATTDPSGLFVGRVSGERYGRKIDLAVTVSIEVRAGSGNERVTTAHEPTTDAREFSIVWVVWSPDRKDLEESSPGSPDFLEDMVSYGPGMDANKVSALARLGAVWHLNTFRSACVHQTVDPHSHRDPCPETGYRFGSRWLVDPLPEDFLRTLRHILKDVDPSGLYTPQESM